MDKNIFNSARNEYVTTIPLIRPRRWSLSGRIDNHGTIQAQPMLLGHQQGADHNSFLVDSLVKVLYVRLILAVKFEWMAKGPNSTMTVSAILTSLTGVIHSVLHAGFDKLRMKTYRYCPVTNGNHGFYRKKGAGHLISMRWSWLDGHRGGSFGLLLAPFTLEQSFLDDLSTTQFLASVIDYCGYLELPSRKQQLKTNLMFLLSDWDYSMVYLSSLQMEQIS